MLNGKLVALGRFLVKLAKQSISFFHALKIHTMKNSITRIKEVEKAFQN